MILDLVDEQHPLLMTKLSKFDFTNPPCDPVELVNNLIETMVHLKGLGLSANQCGLPYNVFVLWSQRPIECFNPRIVDVSHEIVGLEEGCLTYPHMHVKIKRPKIIKVRYQDAEGQIINDKFTGMTARAFQHEMDHLQGMNFLRRANQVHVQRARNNQKQVLRAAKRGELFAKPMFDGKDYEQKIQIQ